MKDEASSKFIIDHIYSHLIKANNDVIDATCVDCSQKGHLSKDYQGCTLYSGNTGDEGIFVRT